MYSRPNDLKADTFLFMSGVYVSSEKIIAKCE